MEIIMHYLYKITNLINQKIYIGQTNNPENRWASHKSSANNPDKYDGIIAKAFAKYGIDSFTFDIIAQCITQDDANYIEIELIKQYDSRNHSVGYNIAPGGETASGWNHTEESKQLMSKIAMGNNHALENTNRLGQTNTEESKQKTSQTMKQKHASGELTVWNKGIASEKHPMFGKKMSEESKAKMRAAKLGKPSPKKGKKYLNKES
jgi:group I intron endonuclease